MIFLIFILFLVALLFISTKVGNLKHRATQHVLRNSGISSSEISAGFSSNIEKMHLEKFLRDFPNFTEDSLKNSFKQYSIHLFNKNPINEFSQNVNEKMQKDSKLDKMQNMEFKRTTVDYYSSSRLNITVVYSDNRDEYELFFDCTIVENQFKITNYKISKGAVLGF